jgi:hypothetical protein
LLNVFANPNARITVRVRVGREYMVSEMVEIFYSQYLANFETRGCGGDFSTQNLPPTHRFRDICKKRLILYGDGKKTGSVDCVECLVALIRTVLSLEQFDWEKTSRNDGCF